MDLKMAKTSQKRANKQHPTNGKAKKKVGPGPLRVVYITNPIKFNATASEFRALVQELTGQYSDLPESDRFTAVGGGGVVDKAAEEEDRDYKVYNHAAVDPQVDKMGHNREEGSQNGSDPLFGFGPYDDDNDINNNNNIEDDMDSFEGLLMGSSSSSSSFWINEGAHYLDHAFKG